MSDDSRRLRLAWYGFTVFLSSAILLVLEINEPLFRTGTPIAELPVFRDDFVAVERMIAGLLLRYEGC